MKMINDGERSKGERLESFELRAGASSPLRVRRSLRVFISQTANSTLVRESQLKQQLRLEPALTQRERETRKVKQPLALDDERMQTRADCSAAFALAHTNANFTQIRPLSSARSPVRAPSQTSAELDRAQRRSRVALATEQRHRRQSSARPELTGFDFSATPIPVGAGAGIRVPALESHD